MQQPSQHPLQQPIQQPAPPFAAPSGSSSAPDSNAQSFHFAHDDALIGPVSPGAALARLLQVEARLPPAFEDARGDLQLAREELARAIGSGEGLQKSLSRAHAFLLQVFERADAAEDAVAICAAMKFPPPGMKAAEVAPVDVSTIVVTHVRPLRQVLSTIAFADAANAIGYRLFETKVLVNGEDYEDSTVANYLPTFTRVRLAAGEHRFRIESRNHYAKAWSDEFTVTVPKP